MLKTIKTTLVLLISILFLSCEKSDIEDNSVVTNSKENIILKFENTEIRQDYNPSYTYFIGKERITDLNEINALLKNSAGLDCDIDAKAIRFIDLDEVNRNNSEAQEKVSAQPNPMVVYRGLSTHNGDTSWHYSFHNANYIGHHVDRWAHHPNASYNGYVVSKNLLGLHLNRITIINYSKTKRVKFGLWTGSNGWVYFYVNEHATLAFNLSPGSIAHSTQLIN